MSQEIHSYSNHETTVIRPGLKAPVMVLDTPEILQLSFRVDVLTHNFDMIGPDGGPQPESFEVEILTVEILGEGLSFDGRTGTVNEVRILKEGISLFDVPSPMSPAGLEDGASTFVNLYDPALNTFDTLFTGLNIDLGSLLTVLAAPDALLSDDFRSLVNKSPAPDKDATSESNPAVEGDHSEDADSFQFTQAEEQAAPVVKDFGFDTRHTYEPIFEPLEAHEDDARHTPALVTDGDGDFITVNFLTDVDPSYYLFC